jgi:hypothetical protein
MPNPRANMRYRLNLLQEGNLELNYNFAADKSLVARRGPTLTCTRAGVAKYWDADGVLQSASANTARFDHDPATGESLGLLCEDGITNQLVQSEDFNTTWVTTDNVVTVNSIAAPDGNTTADLLTQGVAGTGVIYQDFTTTADTTLSCSYYVKKGNNTWQYVSLREAAAGTNRVECSFDITNGVVGTATNAGTGTGAAGYIQDCGNGWYRVTLVGAVNNLATGYRLEVHQADADASTAREANATVYMWGAQAEIRDGASSYIPTTTVKVGRSADDISSSDLSWLTDQKGTFYASCLKDRASENTGNRLWAVSEAAVADAISVYMIANGTCTSRVRDGASTTVNVSSTAITEGTRFRHVFAYQVDDATSFKDGVEAATPDTSCTIPAKADLDEFNVAGRRGTSTTLFNGWIAELRYYDERLDDGVCRSLSIGDVPA